MLFDFIKDPIKKLSLAQQSLGKTEFGRGGVIRVELNPSTNAIQYVISATGERLDTPQEAFFRASTLMMTQFESLSAVSGSVSNLINNPNNPKYAQVGEILSSIQENLKKKSLDPNAVAKLKAMGIDIGSTGTDVSANIIASRAQRGAKPKDFLQEVRRISETASSKGGFIPFIDDEGANLLQLKVGGKILSDEQAYYMLSVIGNPIFNQEKFASVFAGDKPIDAFMEKIVKRMKGLISERDITITEETLRQAFGGKDPKAIVLEEGLDLLKKRFNLGDANSLTQKALIGTDPKTLLEVSVGNSIKSLDPKTSVIQDPQKFIDGFFQRSDIKDLVRTSTSNEELVAKLKKIEEKGIISKDEITIFQRFMDDAEKEIDGITVLNARVINANDKKSKGVIKQLDDQIKQLKENIKNSSSPADRERLAKKLDELQQRRSVIGSAENLYQVTGRGSYGGRGIKTAFDIRDLVGKDFEDVYMIIGRSGLKKEIGLAGSETFVTISGFGSSSTSVYSDPVSVAFHPEIFASKEELESMQQYSAQIMRDFQEAIESDVLPEKIRNMLNKNITEDLSYATPSMRSAKIRNQQYARRILELHQSGIGPKQSPEMMNLLHSTFAAEAFRVTTKEGQARYLPTMPNVFRFAVSTETAAALAGGEESILGKGIENINFKLAGEEKTAELLKFRISNGRLLFAAGGVSEFFESLGGFDLDDKGLPRLMTYEDAQNNRRLAFSLTRQPSGIQESIIASAKLNDIRTLKALFGEKEDFLQALRSITVRGTLEETLLNSLTGTGAKAIKFDSIKEEDIGTIIQNVYTKMGRSIGKMDPKMLQNLVDHGPSALRNTNLYQRSEIYKVFKETGAFDFTLDKEMGELLDNYRPILDSGLYDELKRTLSIADTVTRRNDLTKLINANQNDVGIDALLTNSIFRKMETASLEPGNSLGLYVNRTMVIGSTLNQFDEYMNFIENNIQVNESLKEILQKQIGLVSSETAIDTSVNYSSSRFVARMENTLDLARAAVEAGGSDSDIQRAALKAIGYTDDDIARGLSLDTVGTRAISGLGERIGTATALMTSQEFVGQFVGPFDTSLRPVIDQILLEDRLSDSDILNLFDSIQKGIKEARKVQTLTGTALDQLEEDLLNTGSSLVERRETLGRIFGASKDHKYASMAKHNAIAEVQNAQFNLIKKLGLNSVAEDHILAAKGISEESRKLANVLLDKHSEAYQDATRKLLGESSQLEDYVQNARRYALGQKVYEDITGAQQITGLSREEIINAMDKVAAERSALTRQRGMDLSSLYYSDDENFASQITTTRAKRRADAIRVTAGDLEEQVLNDLVDNKIIGKGPLDLSATSSIINKHFESILEPTTTASEEEKYLAQAILGKKIETTDAEQVSLARKRADVIRTQTLNKALQQDQAVAQALTATGQSTFTGDDSLRSAINAAMNDEDYTSFLNAKGKYVRFSEYIKSGELKNLFKNNNLFRSSIYAAGALIVGSFAYQSFKDHTPEKVQGPPLLPGGSAYEGQYPNRAAEIPQMGTVSYNPGVSYKVNLYGNRRQVSQFQDMAMGLGNFDMDTTMYSGIPQVGTDPYQQLASSY